MSSLLGTLHAILDGPVSVPLWLVTRSAQAVGDSGVDDPDAATAWGFSHVVDLEHPELRCRRIDVDAEDVSEVASLIAAELHDPDTEDTQLAFRGQQRLARRIVRSTSGAVAPVKLDPSGSYIVSGGLRGIGFLVAQWLVEHGARNLVLFGRHDPEPDVFKAIDTLRTAGATVSVQLADVGNDADVQRIVSTAAILAPIRGVIHNAGTLADAILMRQDWQHFQTVYGSKVFGTQSLLRYLDLENLDFLVFFASGAGVAGSAGQANHSAANAYLDALAGRLRRAGVPAASIDWGAWTQLGAAVAHGIDTTPGAFSPAQGLAALGHIINATMQGSGPSQTIVRSSDWSDVTSRFVEGTEPTLYRDLVRSIRQAGAAPRDSVHATPVEKLADRMRGLPERRRRGVLLNEVRRLAARVLDIEQPERIEIGEPLHDLGLDSLMAVELRNLIGLALERELPATLLFEHPSLSALADHLMHEYVDLVDVDEPVEPAPIDNKPRETTGMSTDEIADLLAARLNRLSRGES